MWRKIASSNKPQSCSLHNLLSLSKLIKKVSARAIFTQRQRNSSQKPVGCNTIKRVFDRVWRVGGCWWVDELKPGICKFTFTYANDLSMVLRLNPWTMNRVQLHFYFWPLKATMEQIDFSQAFGRPPDYPLVESTKQISPLIGQLLDHDYSMGGSHCPSDIMRFKTRVKVSELLCLGFLLDKGDTAKSVWIQLKYDIMCIFLFQMWNLGTWTIRLRGRRREHDRGQGYESTVGVWLVIAYKFWPKNLFR